ncbi:MAG: hypothetical protein ACYC8T_10540 [Myxococcaceae bacterium]
MAISLLALGCAHQTPEPARVVPDKAAVFQNSCRVSSPQVQPAQDDAEGTAARLERTARVAADARSALGQLDKAALHDPDLLYGRDRDEFLRSRQRCLNLAAAMERESERLKTPQLEPQKAPPKRAKHAKAKPKHRKAVRMAAAQSSTATR